MDDNKCPICGSLFSPANGMNPAEHLAKGILSAYRGMQEKNEGPNMPPCPRCGRAMCPALNQLFMHSRNNYKERVSVRQGYY